MKKFIFFSLSFLNKIQYLSRKYILNFKGFISRNENQINLDGNI